MSSLSAPQFLGRRLASHTAEPRCWTRWSPSLEREFRKLIFQCSIDVLNWFEKSPAQDTSGDVEKCLADNFKQKDGFLQSFNKRMEIQEKRGKGNIGQERMSVKSFFKNN